MNVRLATVRIAVMLVPFALVVIRVLVTGPGRMVMAMVVRMPMFAAGTGATARIG